MASRSATALAQAGCASGRGDGVIDVGGRAAGERPEHQLGVDGRAGFERADTIAPHAVDKVLVVRAELTADLGRRLLEPRVQVLVVGAERRVGDLDPRLGRTSSSFLVFRPEGRRSGPFSLRPAAGRAGRRRHRMRRRRWPDLQAVGHRYGDPLRARGQGGDTCRLSQLGHGAPRGSPVGRSGDRRGPASRRSTCPASD